MRKVTQQVCGAFRSGDKLKVSNTETDGRAIYLFGNKIAEKREDGLYITLAGWNSNTTRERLNGLAGVSINTKQGQAFLNGKEWGGEWIKVS